MTVSVDYSVAIKRYDSSDPRLGRHKRWDSRSRNFFIPEASSFRDIQEVEHPCYIPILNQGQLGSCTGNAGTENMASNDLWPAVMNILFTTDTAANEKFAVQLYSDATVIDPYQGTYPPTDTGSDALSIATVLKNRGLISGYQHGNSLLSTLTGLQSRAMMTGTEWRGDMFNPTSDGQIKVTGNVEGGHEYLLWKVDVANKRIWMRNSWGTNWGVGYKGYASGGLAWMTWDDYESLLNADGDSTLLIPINQPAPQPTPPEPPKPSDPDKVFAAHANKWFQKNHYFYKGLQNDIRTWLAAKGL